MIFGKDMTGTPLDANYFQVYEYFVDSCTKYSNNEISKNEFYLICRRFIELTYIYIEKRKTTNKEFITKILKQIEIYFK